MADDAPIEIQTVPPERTVAFLSEHERDALSDAWGFRVVWHEQHHAFVAVRNQRTIGALGMRIAASLAHVESIVVARTERRGGAGRLLLARAEIVANYFNCHKMTLESPANGGALEFFEACGYKREATLPQHTWKLDVAVMRKFLL